MAEASLEVAPIEQLATVVEIYNQIFRPERSLDNIRLRLTSRPNPLMVLARLKEKPVGFFLGYEWKPSTFYGWFYGVLPDCRRSGLGSQLMEFAQKWAKENNYNYLRLECFNHQRPMLHLAIELGYNIIGIRWDGDRKDNLVMFEKPLQT